MSAGSRTWRGLSPLPTIASCTSPVSRGSTCPQVREASSEIRKPPKYAISKQPIAFRSSGTEEELHVDIAEDALR